MCILCWSGLITIGFIVYQIVVTLVLVTAVLLADAIGGDTLSIIMHLLLNIANLVLSYYISLVLVFCLPVIVVERASATGALTRAWTMAQGHRCMVFCTLIVTLLAVVLVTIAEGIVLFILGLGSSWTAWFGVYLLNNLFMFPFSAISVTVLYINVRVDKDGLNRDVLHKEFRESEDDFVGNDPNNSMDVSVLSSTGDYQPVLLDDDGPAPLLEDDKSIAQELP